MTAAAPSSLLEAARRARLPNHLARCAWCARVYRPHPGFADHRDRCRLRPMNRPHIIGTANANAISRILQEAEFS